MKPEYNQGQNCRDLLQIGRFRTEIRTTLNSFDDAVTRLQQLKRGERDEILEVWRAGQITLEGRKFVLWAMSPADCSINRLQSCLFSLQ